MLPPLLPPPPAHTPRAATNSALRQVNVGGKTEFDVLEPLPHTNTASYDDHIKIQRHLHKGSAASIAVRIVFGDGQSVIGMKNLKVAFPHKYASLVIGVGGFHSHAHAIFGYNELMWKPLLCYCYDLLQIEKIHEVTKDLENNNYKHVQTGLAVVTIATVCFLLQDVHNPPGRLLLQHMSAYESQVDAAGGVVLIKFLQYAGLPSIQWQRAARESDGAKLMKLYAYSYHVFRSTCHKVNYSQIMLIALLGFCCTIPPVQQVLMALSSVSLLGKTCMYNDRLVEYINKIQQGYKRSSHAASLGMALDMTTLLKAILHVRHTFEKHETGAAPSDDPVTQSMLIQARLLQNEFVRVLGSDLTQHQPDNPFWHTSHAVPLHTGDYRHRRPWEWIWKTADARSCGKGRARTESWHAYAYRFVHDHFFPF